VVAIKGTFLADVHGGLKLAPEQKPLVTTDQHHGDPETTSVRYESDFALDKPLTDVIVVGNAVAPWGRPVERLVVGLEVAGATKELAVNGDRHWIDVLGKLGASASAS